MSDRDELAKVIDENAHVDWFTGSPKELASDILAAGYQKPRNIATLEELESLPQSAVIKPEFGRSWRRGLIYWDNGIHRWKSAALASHNALPAKVVYEGDE